MIRSCFSSCQTFSSAFKRGILKHRTIARDSRGFNCKGSRNESAVSHSLSTRGINDDSKDNNNNEAVYTYDRRGLNSYSSSSLLSPSTLLISSRLPPNSGSSSLAHYYHTSARKESSGAVAVAILGVGSLSAAAFAGMSAVKGYREWKENQPTPEEVAQMEKEAVAAEQEAARRKAQDAEQQQEKENAKKQHSEGKGKRRENIFASWFGMDVGVNYYQGGFEDSMTRREAALILGVRESSSVTKIKGAHRKLLVLNHPDTGGSTFIAGKINEAKELLLKNKVKE